MTPGLPALLEDLEVDTLLIAGTETNVCCESTARDAMMEGYRVVLLSDGTAARSLADHRHALTVVSSYFGDVYTTAEAASLLGQGVPMPARH